jgi:ABC-type glycerol-3-phosphate transport system substrate-binding protein
MKKRVLLLLLSVIAAFTFGACGSGEEGSGALGGKNTLTVVIYDAGYGTQWLKDIGAAFSNVNSGTKVNVRTTVLPADTLSAISGGLYTCDLFMGINNLERYSQYFEDLTGIYNAVPDGEAKTVREKINPTLYDSWVADDGKIYALPWADGLITLCYNKTTLDKVYGSSAYELPRTTDEFWTLADKIRDEAGYYAYTTWNTDNYNANFLDYYWCQYDLASYINYQRGQYVNAEGENVPDPTGAKALAAPGKLKALQFAEKLLKKTNGYTHQRSDAMSFMESQCAWLGMGYGSDKKEVVFCLNGTWMEREIGDFIAAAPNADTYAMRMPVLSAVTDNTETVESDAELSALIKAIDADSAQFDGADTYSGAGFSVSKADYDYITVARSVTANVAGAHQAGIPANAKNKDIAEAFLTFMASDLASQIYSNTMKGITLPYGYRANSSTFSKITQSFAESFSSNLILIPSYNNTKLAQNSVQLVYNQGRAWAPEFFAGSATADALYLADIQYYMNLWSIITQ